MTNWETLAQHRQIARTCALKAYTGEWAWKAISDRLQRPHYMSKVDLNWKIINRKQRKDSRKYSFVNRTIQLGNQLHANVVQNLSCKPSNFRKRLRKVINEVA
jgi:hypothetical protein